LAVAPSACACRLQRQARTIGVRIADAQCTSFQKAEKLDLDERYTRLILRGTRKTADGGRECDCRHRQVHNFRAVLPLGF
jgi:hypothetical protein